MKDKLPQKIEAVIFDWGGVLSMHSPHEASMKLAAKLGVELHEAKMLYRVAADDFKRGKISEEEFWDRLGAAYGQPIADDQRDVWLSWTDLMPEAAGVELIDQLRMNGIKTAVLSNTFYDPMESIRANGGYDMFDEIILSPEVGYAKPDPEIYQLTLDKLALPGERTLFIDDQQRMLDAAAPFGIHTLLAIHPEQVARDVRAMLDLK